MKYMIWYSKKNGLVDDLNINYTSNSRLSKETNWKLLKPYYWCPHSCWYCYVKSNDRGKFIRIPKKFSIEIPFFSKEMYVVKDHLKKIEELIKKDIKRGSKNKNKFMHVAFCSDPFPYSKNNETQYEEIIQNTIAMIKLVNSYDYRIEFLTKWLFPVEKIIKADVNKLNSYWISIPTLDFEYSKKFENQSAPIEQRIENMKELDKNWYNIWINIAPLFLWKLEDKNWNVVYEFKTGLKEIFTFLDSIKNLKHLRFEILRGKNDLQNNLSIKEKGEIEKLLKDYVKKRAIKRYFLDLGDNIIDDDMDANKKTWYLSDETRKKKQLKKK